jgi:hypothetical protein
MKRLFIPISLKEANRFVTMFHRHNSAVVRAKFSIGLMEGEELIGVAIAGRPIARLLDKRTTIEILRTCVKPNHPNANSQLYARMKQICNKMGYTSIITYTLNSESQSSLRAVGASPVADVKPGNWKRPGRHRHFKAIYAIPKKRWELNNNKLPQEAQEVSIVE